MAATLMAAAAVSMAALSIVSVVLLLLLLLLLSSSASVMAQLSFSHGSLPTRCNKTGATKAIRTALQRLMLLSLLRHPQISRCQPHCTRSISKQASKALHTLSPFSPHQQQRQVDHLIHLCEHAWQSRPSLYLRLPRQSVQNSRVEKDCQHAFMKQGLQTGWCNEE
jgi:ribosomal protein L17